MAENVPENLAQPKYVGGTLDEVPTLKGERNAANSPEFFPHFLPGSYHFLYQLAATGIALEAKLGQGLTYIPAGVENIGDALENLVYRPLDEREKPQDRNRYLPFKVSLSESQVIHGDKIDKQAEKLIVFLSKGGVDGTKDEVRVTILPKFLRRTSDKSGRPIKGLEGLTREELIELLTLKKKKFDPFDPAKINELLESHFELPPSIVVYSGRSRLMVLLDGSVAKARLSIRGSNYYTEGDSQIDEREDDTAPAQFKSSYFKSAEIIQPSTDFFQLKREEVTDSERGHFLVSDSLSNNDIEKRLQGIVFDITKRIKLKK